MACSIIRSLVASIWLAYLITPTFAYIDNMVTDLGANYREIAKVGGTSHKHIERNVKTLLELRTRYCSMQGPIDSQKGRDFLLCEPKMMEDPVKICLEEYLDKNPDVEYIRKVSCAGGRELHDIQRKGNECVRQKGIPDSHEEARVKVSRISSILGLRKLVVSMHFDKARRCIIKALS